jgi:hypothetical protein
MAMSDREIDQAEARMAALRQAGHAVSARYDRRSGRVVVDFDTGVQFAFPVKLAEGLADAAPESLSQIEITPAGLGLHWPSLDVDLYLPALLQGVFGSKRWMAQQLGTEGGRVRTDAKAAAARTNGRKGGRPRKPVVA